jgi:methionyl aminopeptidase
VSIKTTAEFEGLRRIGRIVRLTLDRMAEKVKPGITTAELETIGAKTLVEFGAESSPPKVYGFPGAVCISINDQAIHGVPGGRVVESGDLVKLDVTAEKDGFVADAAVTVAAGKVSEQAESLSRCAQRAFRCGAKAAIAGNRVYDIGRAVEKEVRASGFSVMRELCGHGVGRTIHEEPSVPNFYDKRFRSRLTEGLVITIEPIISAGSGRGRLGGDGWTIGTADGALSAHYEHTIAITRSGPVILTAP